MLPTRRIVPAVFCMLCSVLSAQTTAPAYEESKDGLKKWAANLTKTAESKDKAATLALFQDFMLKDPQAFFANVFGEERGPRLAKEYTTELAKFPASMAGLFLQLDSPTRLSVEVECVEVVEDPKAKDFQKIALGVMRNPVALYSVRFFKPGTSASIGIWSIVYYEGSWRFAGKMKTAKD